MGAPEFIQLQDLVGFLADQCGAAHYHLRRPTTTLGRRYSYHRLLYLAAPLLLAVVLLAPLRAAGVMVVAVFLAWWLADSLYREGR